MSIKTSNTKYNLINNKIKYGSYGGINVKSGSLFVDSQDNNVGIGNINPSYQIDVTGNINIFGGVKNYGSNILTKYYPSLSNATTTSDLSSNWTARGTPSEPSINQIDWSPQLKLFAASSQQGLSWRIITSPDGINWTERNSGGIILTNVNQVNLSNCNNGSGNTITCASTLNLAVGSYVSTGSASSSSPFVTEVIDASSFVTNTLISGLSNSSMTTTCMTCTDTSGLLVGMSCSLISGVGSVSARQVLSVPSSTQFILQSIRNYSGATCYADRGYQGMIWCTDLSGVGMFIASAISVSVGTQILTSIDGITWTKRNTPLGFDGLGAGVYAPALKRAVFTAGSSGIIYSDDGINWTGISTPGFNGFYNISWSNDLRLFALFPSNTGSFVLTSPDAVTWTTRAVANIGTQVGAAWSPDLSLFCAIGNSGPNNILTSTDGIDWINRSSSGLAVQNYRNMVWIPELKVFVSAGSTNVHYSYDGITWFRKNLPTSGGMKAITWSPELGIIVAAGNGAGGTGSSDAICTSTLRGNPANINTFDSSFNNINELGLWNFNNFSRGNPVSKTSSPVVLVSGENSVIVNNSSSSTTLTLPTASSWPGLELNIKTTQAQSVISASSNIVQLDGTGPSTSILPATSGSWATLVSDGTNWIIMRS